jgi:hypothetical protein
MEDVGMYYIYGHLVYFRIFGRYILWLFGIILWLFGKFWYVVPRKIWQPCPTLCPPGPRAGSFPPDVSHIFRT